MRTLPRKVALGLTALTSFVIGSLLVFAPGVLFGLNGIVLDPSAAMMSEIRSPGVLILHVGVVATAGLMNQGFDRPALLVSAGLLLAYGVGRLISLPLDGMPPMSLQVAAAVELSLGAWCAMLALPRSERQAASA
ncbi:DUF4345 domain-containing protein [Roseibium sediminicola]|uniref:DUF4345 domain-containing protein n=1 Tax=Roseibium sediminicola TaxID=2933272 RepID=A0ABT0GZB8_9HYPH|nr:DUF4345 domain-containing protein [Roseibium sp. CAU 1639]MCK7614781.1 DUF4345 domain-containing protein [Roseibium sp. CAU 1639]